MDGGGGSSSGTGNLMMGYGVDHHHQNNGNNNLFCPIMSMMPPPMASSSSHQQQQLNINASSVDSNNNNNGTSNNNINSALFLPLLPISAVNIHHDHHHQRSSPTTGGGMVEAENHNNITSTGYYFMENNNTTTNNDHHVSTGDHDHHPVNGSSHVKAKIMSHPLYLRLLASYANCQKIGAPPEMVARLEEACAAMGRHGTISAVGEDPALDQFMEAYCEMLTKYEQELSKPFKEAMLFLSRIESQLKALTISPSTDHSSSAGVEAVEANISSEEEVDVNNSLVDPQAEDRELKGQLLRKYSGYLGSLKQEFMKKRKKGKLPKEARQQLLDWWNKHYKWPYPSETQKLALADSTGLDQKQINNWFINQRKRHWKPSEDMQFVVMDATHPHYYMDNVLGNPFAMDISPAQF